MFMACAYIIANGSNANVTCKKTVPAYVENRCWHLIYRYNYVTYNKKTTIPVLQNINKNTEVNQIYTLFVETSYCIYISNIDINISLCNYYVCLPNKLSLVHQY